MLKTALLGLKKLRLRHFCRKCRKNLNICVLRTKFWVKSACEDAPQVVSACYIYVAQTIMSKRTHLLSLLFQLFGEFEQELILIYQSGEVDFAFEAEGWMLLKF